jgi:hypothetical protein
MRNHEPADQAPNEAGKGKDNHLIETFSQAIGRTRFVFTLVHGG